MEKYKELFTLSLEAYHEQHKRYEGMSDKASKYITALTLLIGIYVYFVKLLLDNFSIHSKDWCEWTLVVIGLLLFLDSLGTWFILLRVLRLEHLYVIPMNDETIKFYDDNRLIDIYYAMAKGIKDTLIVNEDAISKKSKLLGIAYLLLIFYTSLFFIFSVFYLIYKWYPK